MSTNIYSSARNVERKFADPITEAQNSAASDIVNADEKWLLSIYSHWSAPAIKKTKNGSYSTLEYTLDGSQVLKYWRSSGDVIALRFGNTTREIVLDIDVDSPHLDVDSIQLIRHILEDIGLNFCIIHHSSETGGIHLRYPLPEERNTYAIARTVEYALARKGFWLRDGHLEAFPNRKAWVERGKEFPKGRKYKELYDYKAVRLPCQDGYELLDNCLEPVCLDINSLLNENVRKTAFNLAEYRQRWGWCAAQQDMEFLDQMIEFDSDPKNYPKKPRKYGRLADIQKDHEALLERGFEGHHETNQILMDVTRQTRILEPTIDAEDLSRKAKEKVTAMPGYKQYCRHQDEIEKRCLEWARCCIKKGYYYHGDRPQQQTSPAESKGLTNEEKKAKAFKRFGNCLKEFEKNKFSFSNKTELIGAMLKKVGGSKSTVQKYWNDLKQLAVGLIFKRANKRQNQKQTSESNKVSSKIPSKNTDPQLHSVCSLKIIFSEESQLESKTLLETPELLCEYLSLRIYSYLLFERFADFLQYSLNLSLPLDLSYRSIPNLLHLLEKQFKRLDLIDSSVLHYGPEGVFEQKSTVIENKGSPKAVRMSCSDEQKAR